MGIVTFSALGKMGRLGNQMFQIASTIGIAKKSGLRYGFPEWEYNGAFERPIPKLKDSPICKLYQESSFNYRDFILPGNDWNLSGFFQSEKYWLGCKDEVLSYFEFNEELYIKMFTKYANLAVDNVVAVHIRRGDYVKLPEFHTNLAFDYYNPAIAAFKGCNFLIFSDDIEWCKRYFIGHNFFFAEGNTPIEDLCMMSLCDHFIIANSSFSWWAAYLSKSVDKKIIAPLKWFGAKNSHDTSDLIPNGWIRI